MNVRNPAQPAPAAVGMHVVDLPDIARLSLRTGSDGRIAVAQALGIELPTRIGGRRITGALSALCLGPDEWVLHGEPSGSAGLLSTLADLATRLPLSVVDISDREVALAVEGPAAVDLLASGCPLDLARMPVGAGTRTVFDTVQVVLTREAKDRFRLEVWRSFAPHVRALLSLAAKDLALGF